MLIMLLATLLTLLALPCILAPGTVWKALGMGDVGEYDAYLEGNYVAARNPFRESGPPACMAKLIMLRHKINQKGQKKRKQGHQRHSRSISRNINVPRPRAMPWIRLGKQYR